MKLIPLLLALLSIVQAAPVIKSGDVTPGDVALVVSRIPRFPPDKFASLPPSVRDALNLIACQVPQNSLTGGPSNVISGEFAVHGQRDWAALCSNGTLTEVRVVWGGAERCEDRFAPLQDSDSLTRTAPNVFTYTRALDVVSSEQVQRHAIRIRANLPEAPSHDGVEDGIGNGRVVYYCRGGHWHLLQ